jgi:hypothetical protein
MSPLGGPSLRGPAPGLAPRGPAPGPALVEVAAAARATPLVPSSSTGVVLQSGNDHNSISNHIQILDCINYDT